MGKVHQRLFFLFIVDVTLTFGKWIAIAYMGYATFQDSNGNILSALVTAAITWGIAKVIIWLAELVIVPAGFKLEQEAGITGTFTLKYQATERASRRGESE